MTIAITYLSLGSYLDLYIIKLYLQQNSLFIVVSCGMASMFKVFRVSVLVSSVHCQVFAILCLSTQGSFCVTDFLKHLMSSD